jgi:hypothetical protein
VTNGRVTTNSPALKAKFRRVQERRVSSCGSQSSTGRPGDAFCARSKRLR